MRSADADRLAADVGALSAFTESATPGWTRRVFSDAYRASRSWVVDLMSAAGLEVHVDTAGNVVGRLAGRDPSAPPLLTGSHTDTVHGGGRFDGIVGVVGAVEAVRMLRESGAQLDRDLLVVDWLGEEANTFGVSCLGSRAVTGQLQPEHLDRVDDAGVPLGEALTVFGLDPHAALTPRWAPRRVRGYMELHVEQGPLLERSGKTVGVVTAIAGIERLLVTFAGRADHAGTMPMQGRQDALVAAAEAVLTVEREGCGAPVHGVSTTGRIESAPGALNVVPDRARIWAELRSIDAGWLTTAKRRLVERIAADADARGVATLMEWLTDQDPVACAGGVQDVIASAAVEAGLSWEAIPSGAGHDAAHLALLGPMGMIFVPSLGGRSHVPEEDSRPTDIAAGVDVLARTLVRLDRVGPAT